MKSSLRSLAIVAAVCVAGFGMTPPAHAEESTPADLGSTTTWIAPEAGSAIDAEALTPWVGSDRGASDKGNAEAQASKISLVGTKYVVRPANATATRKLTVNISSVPSNTAQVSIVLQRSGNVILGDSASGTGYGYGNNTVEFSMYGARNVGSYDVVAYFYNDNGTKVGHAKSAKKAVVTSKPYIYNLKIKGKDKPEAKKRVTGKVANKKDLKGKVLKVYYKSNSQSKYHYVGKTGKVNSKGKFSFSSTKLGKGRLYVKSYKRTYLAAAKSGTMRIISR